MVLLVVRNPPKPLSRVSLSPITPRSTHNILLRNSPTKPATTQPQVRNPQTRRPRALSDPKSYHRGRLKVPIKIYRWSRSLATTRHTCHLFDHPNSRTTLRLVDKGTICRSVADLSHPSGPIYVDLLRPGSGIPSITFPVPRLSRLHRPLKPPHIPEPSPRPIHC